MKITVLTENTAGVLPGEHGLSLLIEAGKGTYLIDMGQSDLFQRNAEKLGLDLKAVRAAFLSHGHYDHGGGLEAFLKANDSAPVYCSPFAFEKHLGGKDLHENGLDSSLPARYPGRICFVKSPLTVDGCVHILPHTRKATRTFDFFRDCGKGTEPDDFRHEQTIVLEGPKGLCVLSPCTHAGLLQVFEETAAAFPDLPIHTVIGGLHLENPRDKCLLYTREEIQSMCGIIQKAGVQRVITGHCTGGAIGLLKQALGEKCEALYSGLSITL